MTLVLTADGPTRNVHLVAVLLASFAVSGVVVLFGNAYLAVAAEVAALRDGSGGLNPINAVRRAAGRRGQPAPTGGTSRKRSASAAR